MQSTEPGLLLSNITSALILQPAKSRCHPLKSALKVAASVSYVSHPQAFVFSTVVISSESRNHRKQESQPPGGDFFSPATIIGGKRGARKVR